MRRISILLTILLSFSLIHVPTAFAATTADVTNNQAVIDFPNTITFQAKITAASDISSIVLEYGTEQLTCGDVIAKAYPQFNPAKSVNADWTWDMRQGSSLPPGTTIWWRWRYTDSSGKESVTDQQSIIWLDGVHKWQSATSGQLHLHWYGIDKSLAQAMLTAGVNGLKHDAEDAGLKTDDPIDIYVYPNYSDLRDAILFEASWTGGQAFPEHDIVILGSSGGDEEWDKSTVVHELTHVLVGHLTFSCLSFVPQWLNEGLAVYSEGPLTPQFEEPLKQAIKDNTLLSVRSISNAFSELPDRADLSYGQSFSLVNFLIETYGQDKMTALLTALRDGGTIDDALTQTYGFNIDGLEDAWRKSIGAQPRTTSAEPTAQPTPTYVPTIVPISGAPLALQATATPVPTSSFDQTPTTGTPSAPNRPPLWLTLALLGFCCIFILIIGVIVLGVVVRNQNMKRGKNG